jgi:hypothetical protein
MTRPSAAPTPSTWKYVPETSSPDIRSVWAPPSGILTFIWIGRRAKRPEKIFGVAAGLGTAWLTRGSFAAPSTKLSRKSSYIGYEIMLPPELLP